jgi:hypothetical protein
LFLKTGAYRPADLARAIAWASKYKLDLLTVDGAGGGTGMSPWRTMNEWGIPARGAAFTALVLSGRGESVEAAHPAQQGGETQAQAHGHGGFRLHGCALRAPDEMLHALARHEPRRHRPAQRSDVALNTYQLGVSVGIGAFRRR